MIDKYRKHFDFYSNGEPKPETNVELLASIQHFGGHTRLLDFSESIYVATYFAVNDAIGDSCVWGLNRGRLAKDLCMQNSTSFDKLLEEFEATITPKILEPICPGIIPITPERLNSRSSRQQGLFYASFSHLHTFSENLLKSFDIDSLRWKKIEIDELNLSEKTKEERVEFIEKVKAIRIIIPFCLRPDIRNMLREMNIGGLTLFGGLPGLARHVSETGVT